MTIAQVNALSPEEIRVRIAKLCWWKETEKESCGETRWIQDDREAIIPRQGMHYLGVDFVPDYPASLDACTEFEKELKKGNRFTRYQTALFEIQWERNPNIPETTFFLGGIHAFQFLTASALDRCKARLLMED